MLASSSFLNGMLISTLISTYVILFPITNPLGNAAVFLSITKGEKEATRSKQAFRGALFMFLILETFFLFGTAIMSFFGISLIAIRIAGGVVISRISLGLLNPQKENSHSDEEHAEACEKPDISFTPLAMPLLAGPGAIATIIALAVKQDNTPVHMVGVSCGILLSAITCWIALRESHWLMKLIGVNGANALTRIMGFLLLCIGVQMLISGIQQIKF